MGSMTTSEESLGDNRIFGRGLGDYTHSMRLLISNTQEKRSTVALYSK